MPDSISGITGLRPVVRRVSVTQKDLINRFERSGSSTSSSVSNSGSNTPTSLVSRSRAGSLKKTSVPKSSSTAKTTTTDSTTVTPRVKTEVSFESFLVLLLFSSHFCQILLSPKSCYNSPTKLTTKRRFQEDAESSSSLSWSGFAFRSSCWSNLTHDLMQGQIRIVILLQFWDRSQPLFSSVQYKKFIFVIKMFLLQVNFCSTSNF